jgi:hypothetical protein
VVTESRDSACPRARERIIACAEPTEKRKPDFLAVMHTAAAYSGSVTVLK